MNIYYQCAERLADFMALKARLPLEEVPMRVRTAYQSNPNIASTEYIQRKDKAIREAQQSQVDQIKAMANDTKMNGSSFQIYQNGLVRRVLTYLEQRVDDLDLATELNMQLVVGAMDYIHLCKRDDTAHQDTVRRLCEMWGAPDGRLSVNTLLNMLCTLILVPMRNSTNSHVLQCIENNRAALDALLADRELAAAVTGLTSHHIYEKLRWSRLPRPRPAGRSATGARPGPQAVEAADAAEEQSENECECEEDSEPAMFRPRVNKNTDKLVSRHDQRLVEQLLDLNIKEKLPENAGERAMLYKKLQRAKQ